MIRWAPDAVFYHIFPLGLCGAPRSNDRSGPPARRLELLTPWFDHARDLGATALLLGPMMESGTHGYDVIDYFDVDRRLGDRPALAHLVREAHHRGLRVVFDAVFNHAGRDFRAFRDVRAKGRDSRFADWFHLDFQGRSPLGDPFSYQTWNGCHDLVKLNLGHPEARGHLFDAVSDWIGRYDIDGLRLDAAEDLDPPFIRDLGDFCRGQKPDFWLMGEVVKGPYKPRLDMTGMDSVTNYVCYKGLFFQP